MTLIRMADEHKSTSFLFYAALELRMAIEQQFLTIIALVKGSMDEPTIARCRKKNGLLAVLKQVSPKYTLLCRFGKILADFYPQVPDFAQWDVKILTRHFNDLARYCHSPLLVDEVEGDHSWSAKTKEGLIEIYDYMAMNLSKGTMNLRFHDSAPIVRELYEKFCTREITESDLSERYKLIKPYLEEVSKIRNG